MLGRALGAAVFTLTMMGCPAVFGAGSTTDLVVSDRDCAAFQSYVPDPSVEAKPGVDVRGRPVAQADLDGQLQVAPNINIPITVDIRPWTDINPHHPGHRFHAKPDEPQNYDTQSVVGVVSFVDGKLYFNGQPLGSAGEHAVLEACADYLKRERR
jgi:hypothetical protein